MPAQSENVRSSGKTGSDQCAARTTRLTPQQTFGRHGLSSGKSFRVTNLCPCAGGTGPSVRTSSKEMEFPKSDPRVGYPPHQQAGRDRARPMLQKRQNVLARAPSTRDSTETSSGIGPAINLKSPQALGIDARARRFLPSQPRERTLQAKPGT
jgi:hypothetical protein